MSKDDPKTPAPADAPCEKAVQARGGALADAGLDRRQSSEEALARIDELLADASGEPEAVGGTMGGGGPVLRQAREWRPAGDGGEGGGPTETGESLRGDTGDPPEGKR